MVGSASWWLPFRSFDGISKDTPKSSPEYGGASEGARLGARADAAPGMGAARARELIGASLSERYADDVSVGTGVVGGVQVVEVRVRAPFPVIGLLGPDGRLDVTRQRNIDEKQRSIAARSHRLFDDCTRQNRFCSAGRGDDDVRLHQRRT